MGLNYSFFNEMVEMLCNIPGYSYSFGLALIFLHAQLQRLSQVVVGTDCIMMG
jgi:hypothetical protein